MESPVRVFLIHRYRLLIDALKVALARDASIDLVGQTPHFNQACRGIADLDVDVVLIEAELDETPERPMIRRLKSVFPELDVIVIGLETTEQILQCIEAGANGYLEVEAALPDLVRTLRLMGQGKALCSPEVAVSIFARIAELARVDNKRRRQAARHVSLTKREHDILELLGLGLRNKEIARQLGIAIPTVKNHVHKVLDKLGVRRRRDAVRLALELGLLKDRHGR